MRQLRGSRARQVRQAPAIAAPSPASKTRSRRRALLSVCIWLVLVILAGCQTAPPAGRQAPTATATAQPTTTGSGALSDVFPAPPKGMQTPEAAVNAMMRRMTLDQKLGQLFIVEYLYTDPNHSDLHDMIGRLGAGGVILYKSMNIESVPQMRRLTGAMQSAARIPLIIGADEEGGGDDQTDGIFGAHPTAWDIGQSGDPKVAAQNATRIAKELKQLGMNADFAPVVDVLDPSRAWIRAFSRSPQTVSRMGAAQVDAMQKVGVMACLKHFPGLGAATVNPHKGLPVINSSRQHIEQVDLTPYRALMAHHPAMIMTTDLLMPALDPKMPAELSYPIVTGILRKEIGYDGVVVTDALYMGGIADRYSMPEAGVLAIMAGNDMLEGPWNAAQMSAMVSALRSAVHTGRISKVRIDASVRRILLLKLRYGMLPAAKTHTHAADSADSADTSSLAVQAATPASPRPSRNADVPRPVW